MNPSVRKIAYVISAFPVASETFITTEMRTLKKIGIEIQPICFERMNNDCQPGDEEFLLQIESTESIRLLELLPLLPTILVKLFISGWKGLYFAFQQQGIRPRSLIFHALKLALIIHKSSCDHVHAHFAWSATATAIVAARLLGLKVSFTGHGSDVYKTPSDLQLKLQNADFSIAVCKRMQDDFFNLAPDANVFVIPCGIDTDYFKPTPANLKMPVNFLYLGRISETKGVDHLIHAIALMQPEDRPNIDIAGDGPWNEMCKKLVAELGVGHWVNFVGQVNRDWVRRNASAYRAMVLPFCKTPEGIMDTGPLVLKEAMALKVPLITTDIMAGGELLDGNSATIVRSADAQGLAAAIKEHVNIPENQSKSADIGRKTERAYRIVMQRFSARQQALSLLSLMHTSGGRHER